MLICSPRIIEGRSEQTPKGSNGPKVKNEKQNKLRIIRNEPLTSSPARSIKKMVKLIQILKIT